MPSNFCGLCRRTIVQNTYSTLKQIFGAPSFFSGTYMIPYFLRYTLESSSLASHFFGLILTFCTDLFSFFAPGTKATGREFVPQRKVKISPNSVEFSTDQELVYKSFFTLKQYAKYVKCDDSHNCHIFSIVNLLILVRKDRIFVGSDILEQHLIGLEKINSQAAQNWSKSVPMVFRGHFLRWFLVTLVPDKLRFLNPPASFN